MEHIKAHIGDGARDRSSKRDRATQRGELMRYFMQKLNQTRTRDHLPPLTMARMGKVLQAIPTDDLYYLKSVCDDAGNRGGLESFSKRFWWELKPKPQEGEDAVQSKAPPKKRPTKAKKNHDA